MCSVPWTAWNSLVSFMAADPVRYSQELSIVTNMGEPKRSSWKGRFCPSNQALLALLVSLAPSSCTADLAPHAML